MKERITVLGKVTRTPAWTLLAYEIRDFELDEFPNLRIAGRNHRRQIDGRKLYPLRRGFQFSAIVCHRSVGFGNDQDEEIGDG